MPEQHQEETKQDTSVSDGKLVGSWVERLKKAEDALKPYWEEEKRFWEHWWMWSERSGPYRSNYVPPDAHAAVESVTPRLTKSRPHLRVLPRITQDMSIDQAQSLIGKTKGVEALDRYAWQEMHSDITFEKFVKRGIWMGFSVEKITWRTETTEVEEEEPIIDLNFFGMPVQAGTKKVKRTVPLYDSPVSELIDSSDFIYPLGYDDAEKLPWGAHRIVKWRSELDESLYSAEALKKLDEIGKDHRPADHKTERLRIREFPEPYAANTTENPNQVNATQGLDGVGNEEDDYQVELVEIYVRANKKHPNGRLLTIANNKELLRDVDNPTPDGDLPFNIWTPISDTYHLRGMGIVREGEKVLLYKKKQRDQRLDNVDLVINNRWLVQEEENVDDDEFISFAGSIIRVSDINTSAKPLFTPDTTGASVREEQIMDGDGQKATAVNEYLAGALPKKETKATEVEKVTASSSDRLDAILRTLNRSLNRRGKLILKLYQQNWDAPQLARIVGDDGAIDLMQLDPLEFEGDFEFMYDVRPVLATKEVVRSQLMEMLSVLTKIPSNDPRFAGINIRPVIQGLVETFEEVKIDPKAVLPDLPEDPGLPLPPDGQEPPPFGPDDAGNGATPSLASILSSSNRF